MTIPVTCSTQLKLVIRSPISDEALLFFALLPFPMSTILCIHVVVFQYFPYQMILTLSRLPQNWNRAYYLYSDPDETLSVELVIVLACSVYGQARQSFKFKNKALTTSLIGVLSTSRR